VAECVKCGHRNAPGAPACVDCTWPFTVEAWASTNRFHIRRITVDTSCVNSKRKDADLNVIERWAEERRIILQRSDALLKELGRSDERVSKGKGLAKHPKLFTLGVSVLNGEDVLAGPDMRKEIEQILFPTVRVLTTNQVNDVEHLRQHVRTGCDAFITKDAKDFIKRGKQEKLAQIGIWVFTPSQLVSLLRKLYNWP